MAALTLAGLVQGSGLADRAAHVLARAAGGSMARLYLGVCALCAALTAVVSLDGAVVLMVPVVLVLVDRFDAAARPLLLGVAAVANASSLAVPAGNPTNLVLMNRLGLSAGGFVVHMLVPGLLAALAWVAAVAVLEQRLLKGTFDPPRRTAVPLSSAERHAVVSLAAAALASCGAPFAGVAPWWPFAGAAGLAVLTAPARSWPVIPLRIATQVGALVILTAGIGLRSQALPPGLLGLLATAGGVAVAAAIMNNLPACVWAGAVIAGPLGYAASIGLAIGSMATPQGSVATMIVADLAGAAAPSFPRRAFTLITAGSLLGATLLLWIGT